MPVPGVLRRLVKPRWTTKILDIIQNFEKIVLREFLKLCEWSGGACGKNLEVCETCVHRHSNCNLTAAFLTVVAGTWSNVARQMWHIDGLVGMLLWLAVAFQDHGGLVVFGRKVLETSEHI